MKLATCTNVEKVKHWCKRKSVNWCERSDLRWIFSFLDFNPMPQHHKPRHTVTAHINLLYTTTTISFFFYLNASTLNNTDTVRPGGGEKTLRSSRLPPPKYMLSKTLNELAQRPWANQQKRKQRAEHCFNLNHTCTFQIMSKSKK